MLVAGCDLLASESTEERSATGAGEASTPALENRPEKVVVETRYDTSDVRAKGTVAGLRVDVQELTPTIGGYGLVNVMLSTEHRGGFLPWRIQGVLGQLDVTYAFEPGRVYVLFETIEKDVVRSALPTGTARVVLTHPRDTVSRTTTDHRVNFFEEKLRQLGFWGIE